MQLQISLETLFQPIPEYDFDEVEVLENLFDELRWAAFDAENQWALTVEGPLQYKHWLSTLTSHELAEHLYERHPGMRDRVEGKAVQP